MIKSIIGYGGFAKEVYWSLKESERKDLVFFVEDNYWVENKNSVLPLSKFDPKTYETIIAIGDSNVRYKITKLLPHNTKYFTHIHPSCQILGNDIQIGEGSIICSNVIITTNIKIGSHSHLNLSTTIGHDSILGDFFTTSPGVKISGNCIIGNHVYFGTNSCTKQKIKICDNVTVGLNSGVTKDIIEPGTYIGTPSKKIK